MELQEANYKPAYNILVDRYTSPRRLINYYLGQILSYKGSSSTHYLTVHVNCIQALKALHVTDLTDSILFHLSYHNLDTRFKRAFDNAHDSKIVPTCKQLLEFITQRAKTEELQLDLQSPGSSKQKSESKTNKTSSSSFFATKSVVKNKPHSQPAAAVDVCPVCNQAHRIYSCQVFLSQQLSQKYDSLKSLRRCFKCLGSHVKDCTSTGCCKVCSSTNHHTLLHPPSKDNDAVAQTTQFTCNFNTSTNS